MGCMTHFLLWLPSSAVPCDQSRCKNVSSPSLDHRQQRSTCDWNNRNSQTRCGFLFSSHSAFLHPRLRVSQLYLCVNTSCFQSNVHIVRDIPYLLLLWIQICRSVQPSTELLVTLSLSVSLQPKHVQASPKNVKQRRVGPGNLYRVF